MLCAIFFPEQMAVAYPLALSLGNFIDTFVTMVKAASDYVASFIVSRYTENKDLLQRQLAQNKQEGSGTERGKDV